MTEETLRSRLEVYLQLRQSLGYQTPVHQQALRDFVNYLAAHDQPGPIRAATAALCACLQTVRVQTAENAGFPPRSREIKDSIRCAPSAFYRRGAYHFKNRPAQTQLPGVR